MRGRPQQHSLDLHDGVSKKSCTTCKCGRALSTKQFPLFHLRHEIFLSFVWCCWNLIVLDTSHRGKNICCGKSDISGGSARRKGQRGGERDDGERKSARWRGRTPETARDRGSRDGRERPENSRGREESGEIEFRDGPNART